MVNVCILVGLLYGNNVGAEVPPQTIKVGILLPVTGSLAEISRTHLNGHHFAVEEINKQGGIQVLKGTRLELLLGDSRGDPAIGNLEVQRLAKEGAVAIIGAYQSTVTYTTTELAERIGIPYLIPTSLADSITQRGFRYTFRPEANVSQFVRDQYRFLEDYGLLYAGCPTTIALLYENTLFGQLAAIAQRAYANRRGYRIVADLAYPATREDLLPVVLQLTTARPNIVLQSSYLHDAIRIARAMKQLHFSPDVMLATGAGPKDPVFIQRLGREADFWLVINEWNNDMQRSGATDLNQRFRRRYGQDLDGISAMSYVTTWVLKEAIERAGASDRESVRDALEKIYIDRGPASIVPLGRIALDTDGQGEFAALVTQIVNGKHRTVWPKELATSAPIIPRPPWGPGGWQEAIHD